MIGPFRFAVLLCLLAWVAGAAGVGVVRIEPLGTMRERLERNFNRLEESKYQPDHVFLSDAESGGWPGDTEGRTILGLVLDAQATGREPKYLAEILTRLESKLNEKGYMGAVLPIGKADEQQLSGNGWMLRGLCEYYRLRHEARTKEQIRRLARGLYLPLKGRFAKYPIDPNSRQKDVGAPAGSRLEEVDGWILSSDVGCFAIGLDGLVQAWELTGDAELRPVIEEMITRILEIDLVAIRAQTHATLTGLRALLRYANACSTPRSGALVSEVEKRFTLYRRFGMTEYYENVNWFRRYDTWTEPCAIVDSYLLAVTLWRRTKRDWYLELADLIWWNALVPSQRANGGFGTHNIPGLAAKTVERRDLIDECHWCCTMRGAEGLAFGVTATAFAEGNTLTVAQFHEGLITAALDSGRFSCRLETDYPQTGRVSLSVLSAPKKPLTLRLFCPSYLEPDLSAGLWTRKGLFCERTATFAEGEKMTLSFDLKTRVAPPVCPENIMTNSVKRLHGPLVSLGV